jgi:nicotinate-nucleotide adenylyltransferase
MRKIPMAIISRPGFTTRARVGRAARMFANSQLDERLALTLPDKRPPAWILIEGPLHTASATVIRRQGAWP